MMYSYFLLFGVKDPRAEETTTLGRIDVVIEEKRDVYVIEIIDKTKEPAYFG